MPSGLQENREPFRGKNQGAKQAHLRGDKRAVNDGTEVSAPKACRTDQEAGAQINAATTAFCIKLYYTTR